MPGIKRKRDAKKDARDNNPPVYLVVENKADNPAYSFLKADTAGTTTTPLRGSERGMSFTAAESRWIVGVGGEYRGPVTIYDLTTSVESCGPWVGARKLDPVLIPLRGNLYVLSRRPAVYRGLDFLPSFERMSFRNGPPNLCEKLPPPPIFPCRINPIEYLDPPDVRVSAYAAVGSHILLSVSVSVQHQQQQDKGTWAFDVDREVWEMVIDKNLPFLGQAVPLCGHLFVPRSKDNKDGAASVYHIEVLSVSDSSDTRRSELRIVELPPVVPEGCRIVPGQLLCASGEGRFCSFDVRFKVPTEGGELEKARVVHRTYRRTVEDDGTETTNPPVNVNVIVKRRRRQIFKVVDRSRRLGCPTPVVAALTL